MNAPFQDLKGFAFDLSVREMLVGEADGFGRYPVSMPVVVKPISCIDGRYEPCGPVFQASTTEISALSISLMLDHDNKFELLAVSIQPLDGDEINVVLKVVRCQPMGAKYLLDGHLVARIISKR